MEVAKGASSASPEELSTRSLDILRAIVQDFIASGEPVGSLSIAPRCDVSPATVRSAMSDLEELGYLGKPHTSAGRIPTDKAYRLYVDSLLRVRQPAAKDLERIDRAMQPASLPELISETSRLLHQLTHHAAVVIAPRFDQIQLHRVEFVKLREDRVLAIFVSSSGIVQNRLITVDFPVAREELEHATNYLTELLGSGLSLEQVQARLKAELEHERAALDALLKKSLDLGTRALAGVDAPPQLVIEGEESFLDAPEFAADVDRMRKLFAELAQKDRLLQVLGRAADGREIQIFIGTESEFSASAGVSLVAAPYSRGDVVFGALAVIGPTRMNYGKVIPLVDYTARAVSRSLAE